jgi:hypothetical protein
MTSSSRRFPSRIDAWLVALTAITLIAVAIPVLRAALDGSFGIVTVLVVAAALVCWPFLTTGYEMTDDTLVVRCAMIRRRIPLASITALRPTRSPWSAPALSLDRLEVVHETGSVLVSPRDKAGFVRALRAAVPSLDIGAVPDADAAPTVARRRANPVAIFNIIIFGPVIFFVSLIVYQHWQPPEAAVTSRSLLVRSGSAQEIPLDDIVGLSLDETLPPILRRLGGFRLGGTYRGRFDVEELGEGQLLLQHGRPPYVVVRLRTSFLIINYADPGRTRALFDELQGSWRRRP